jgi:hypothetical protein
VGQMRWQFELFFRYFHPMCRTPRGKPSHHEKNMMGAPTSARPSSFLISRFLTQRLLHPIRQERRVPQPHGCQLRYRTRNGRRYQRRRRLPGAGWVIVGLDYLNVHQWYLPHARHVVVVEVALLHHAVRRS